MSQWNVINKWNIQQMFLSSSIPVHASHHDIHNLWCYDSANDWKEETHSRRRPASVGPCCRLSLPLLSSTCNGQSDSESSVWTSRYLCVRPDSRHADACPAAAGMQGLLTQMWWTCKTLQSCMWDIYKSTGFRTFNTLHPSCTSFSSYSSLRSPKLKRTTSGSVNWAGSCAH